MRFDRRNAMKLMAAAAATPIVGPDVVDEPDGARVSGILAKANALANASIEEMSKAMEYPRCVPQWIAELED